MVAQRRDREQLDKAQAALAKNDLKKAIVHLEAHLERYADDADVRMRLANLYAQTGRQKEAWEWIVNAASGFAAKGFLDKAIALLHRAFEIDTSRPETAMLAADYQVKRGRVGEAKRALENARAKLTRRRDRAAALEIAKKRVQLAPDVDGWIDVATLMAATGNTSQGVMILDEQCAKASAKDERKRYLKTRLRIRPTPRSLWRWLRG